jgi:hypothetical protein
LQQQNLTQQNRNVLERLKNDNPELVLHKAIGLNPQIKSN